MARTKAASWTEKNTRARKLARQAVDLKINHISDDLGSFLEGDGVMAAYNKLVASLKNSEDDAGVADSRAAFIVGLELGRRIGGAR